MNTHKTHNIIYVKILDKRIPYEFLRNYIMTLWTYKQDHERCKAHDKIFDYLDVDRFAEENHKYFEAIDTIVCYAFVCCGLSVDRNNVCKGKCGQKLTMQMSLFYMDEYLNKKDLIIK
jgi:hypothetical protein